MRSLPRNHLVTPFLPDFARQHLRLPFELTLVLFDLVEVMVDGAVGTVNRIGVNHVSENEESLEIKHSGAVIC